MKITCIALTLSSADHSSLIDINEHLEQTSPFKLFINKIATYRFFFSTSLGWTLLLISVGLENNPDFNSSTCIYIVTMSLVVSVLIGLVAGVILSLISKYYKALNEIPMYEI